ncbi:MAG: transposase [Methanotrichaceae archaeon]|nr:transposase [Methanotrichaceae archaeon]
MTKTRRKYDREFKLSVIAELDSGKPLVQIAREHGIHPSLPCRWKNEFATNPEGSFRGNGRRYKEDARIDELERLLGQLYAENELLKKALSVLEQRAREESRMAMEEILAEIQSGEFAREWILESQAGLPVKRSLEQLESEHLIEEVGAELRAMMPWLGKN